LPTSAAPGPPPPPDPSAPSDAERRRIEDVYAGYRAGGRSATWDPAAPGNRCMLDERRAQLGQLARRWGSRPLRVVEVGCGAGGVLADLASVAPAGSLVAGVDLLADRLGEARAAGFPVARADGRLLPLPPASVDVVAAFTVFSSVLDAGLADAIAAEIGRVLRPGGRLLWYDLRYPSPGNRNVRPLGRRPLRALFPGWERRLRSLTVAPPLARRLGARDRRLYPLVARLPAARSHLFGELVKPG
jgi:SAM-dependent methyltransferase